MVDNTVVVVVVDCVDVCIVEDVIVLVIVKVGVVVVVVVVVDVVVVVTIVSDSVGLKLFDVKTTVGVTRIKIFSKYSNMLESFTYAL